MSDEYESLNSRIPDFASALAQRIAIKKGDVAAPSNSSTFDPYQAMLKKKVEETAPIDPSTVQRWPEKDLKALQDYCQEMGIMGFNCGRMSPMAALAMLKKQFNQDYTNVPLEERVPTGYEKINSNNKSNPDYPYSRQIGGKQIIHG